MISAGRVIDIYPPQYEKRTFDVSAPSYFLLSLRPNRRGNTNIIRSPTRPMTMAQTTCQDEGNISAILNQARDMRRQGGRETMLVCRSFDHR